MLKRLYVAVVTGSCLGLGVLFIYWLLFDKSPVVTPSDGTVLDVAGLARSGFHRGEAWISRRTTCSDEDVTTRSNGYYHNRRSGIDYLTSDGQFIIKRGCITTYSPHVVPAYLTPDDYEWRLRASYPLNPLVTNVIDFPAVRITVLP